MPEAFLILLSAGIMLAAAVSDPRQVTLNWLRLAGIIAVAMAGVGIFFATRTPPANGILILIIMMIGAILAQLASTQLAARRLQRVCAILAFAVGVNAASYLLRPQPLRPWPVLLSA